MSGLTATAASPGLQPAITSTRTAPFTVELRRDLDLGLEDTAAVDALIAERPGVGIFLTRAWLSGLFADPPAGCEPSLAILRQGAAIRGVAPVAIRQARTHLRVALLGGGAGSDRVDLLAARGCQAGCADAFFTWLGEAGGRRGFILELRDVPADSPLWGAAHRANAERGLRLAVQPRDIHTLPYVDLTGSAAGLPSGTPAARLPVSLEKHRRWLERRGPLRTEILQDSDEVMDAFERLVGLLHARWRDRGQRSALDDPRALRLHRHALPMLLSAGRLRMMWVLAGTRVIAVFWGLALGRWWGYYLAGYDRDWAGRIHLGQLTLAAAMEMAAKDGATEFDFLKGAERVKYLWPVRERATVDADIYSAESGAQLNRATQATREAAGALARSARHLWDTFGHSLNPTFRR